MCGDSRKLEFVSRGEERSAESEEERSSATERTEAMSERYIILKGRRLPHIYTGADTLCVAARTREQLVGAEILERLPERRTVCFWCQSARENYQVSNGDGERKERREAKQKQRKNKGEGWGDWLF